MGGAISGLCQAASKRPARGSFRSPVWPRGSCWARGRGWWMRPCPRREALAHSATILHTLPLVRAAYRALLPSVLLATESHGPFCFTWGGHPWTFRGLPQVTAQSHAVSPRSSPVSACLPITVTRVPASSAAGQPGSLVGLCRGEERRGAPRTPTWPQLLERPGQVSFCCPEGCD